MRLWRYDSLEQYRKNQIVLNKAKLAANPNVCWVRKDEILKVANYIKKHIGLVKFGLCHGTRRGIEQQWFRKYLDADVIGTEISDTASQFPHTIQWDFHEIKDEWVGNVDFIYSNSLDHSYDPAMCLSQWMKCLRNGGLCFVHWSKAHRRARPNSADCFSGSLDDYMTIISRNHKLRDTIICQKKPPRVVLVAQN